MVRAVRTARTARTASVHLDGEYAADINKTIEIVANALVREHNGKILVFCDRTKRHGELVELLGARAVAAVRLGADGRAAGLRADYRAAFKDSTACVGVAGRRFALGIDDANIGTVVLVDVPMTGGGYL